MSAFFGSSNNKSQAELMEQYMQWSNFQKQQQEQKQSMAMFEQFMKQQSNQEQQPMFNQQEQQPMFNQQEQRKEPELPLFEQFMKQQFKAPQAQTPSFIPFDIDNFNGDGLQKSFDLAYQNESQKLSSSHSK